MAELVRLPMFCLGSLHRIAISELSPIKGLAETEEKKEREREFIQRILIYVPFNPSMVCTVLSSKHWGIINLSVLQAFAITVVTEI